LNQPGEGLASVISGLRCRYGSSRRGPRWRASSISGHQGTPVAAVNVAVPTAQYTVEQLASEVGPRVAETADAIAAELGIDQRLASRSAPE